MNLKMPPRALHVQHVCMAAGKDELINNEYYRKRVDWIILRSVI